MSMVLGVVAAVRLATLAPDPTALRIPTFKQDTAAAQRLANDLVPRVEAAVGLKFKRPPRIAVRSRDQLRLYINHKLAEDYPPAEMAALERTYHAFGVVPDSVEVRTLLANLLTEQVAGFYDPDSTRLFVIRGFDPQVLRLIMAHELVHALQDQYTSVNAVLKARGDDDRQTAGQSIFEGQAMLASLRVLQPAITDSQITVVLDMSRHMGAAPAASMPQLASAPRFITSGLIFPYIEGAAFLLAFESTRSDSAQPYGALMPVSTEQILHPARYAIHDVPARIRFAPTAPGDTVVHEDDLGEFETAQALIAWGVAEDMANSGAAGWNGDRYRLLGTRQGQVLEWATAWDTPEDASEFARRLRTGWATRASHQTGRKYQVDELTVNGVKVVRLVDAPAGWTGWTRLPAVTAMKVR